MTEYEDPTPENGGNQGGYRRESPAVYRRRRIIALILALLVIVLVVWGVVFAVNKIAASIGGGSGGEASQSSTDNFASFSARPSQSASGSSGPSGSAGPSASASSSDGASASDKPSDQAEGDQSEKPDPDESKAEAVATTTPTESKPAQPQACGSDIQVSANLDKGAYGQGENPVMSTTVKNSGDNPCNVDLGANKVTYEITSGSAEVYSTSKCGGDGAAKQSTLEAGSAQTVSQSWDRSINALGCGDAAQPAQSGYYWLTVSVNGVPSEKQQIVLE